MENPLSKWTIVWRLIAVVVLLGRPIISSQSMSLLESNTRPSGDGSKEQQKPDMPKVIVLGSTF
jgi:hypothetical protein